MSNIAINTVYRSRNIWTIIVSNNRIIEASSLTVASTRSRNIKYELNMVKIVTH